MNPIGTKGKLTVKYAKMIQALWCKDSNSYSPSVLKNAISEFQPMFSGYSQHDSQ
jgi:ubiquitin carboxyl-terminal hydrolase 4/11/15